MSLAGVMILDLPVILQTNGPLMGLDQIAPPKKGSDFRFPLEFKLSLESFVNVRSPLEDLREEYYSINETAWSLHATNHLCNRQWIGYI